MFGSEDGFVYAVKAPGELVWRFNASSGVYSSPAVVDSVVYIGTEGGDVVALALDSGKLLWRFTTPSAASVFSSPAVFGGRVFFGGCRARGGGALR